MKRKLQQKIQRTVPTAKSVYDFKIYDKRINILHGYGRKIIYVKTATTIINKTVSVRVSWDFCIDYNMKPTHGEGLSE